MLLNELRKLIPSGEEGYFLQMIRDIQPISPFHVAANMQMWLMDKGILTFQQALQMQEKHGNKNKKLFEMPETTFGIKWGQKHILEIDPRFQNAPPNFDHHDLVLINKKIEVKATRAVRKGKGPLAHRALNSTTLESYQMNFNHIFLDEADVYAFMVVWTDDIWYWVIPKDSITIFLHKYQNEYQMPINAKVIDSLIAYRCERNDIANKIISTKDQSCQSQEQL